MKVAFVHDHELVDIPDGGAQRTTHELIGSSPFDIALLTPIKIDAHDLDGFDVLIVSNCKFFTTEQLTRVIQHRCTVKFERDFYNLAQPGHEVYRKAIFERSAGNVFLSPLHYARFKQLHPDIQWDDGKVRIHHVPVDVSRFNPQGKTREDVYTFVGSLVAHKGMDNLVLFANQYPTVRVKVYGRGTPESTAALEGCPNIELLGVASYDDMPDIYNRSARFLFLPSEVEPFGRVAAEARLCGCEMLINDNVGAASHDWFFDYSRLFEKMRTASQTFWELILDIKGRTK
jgi:glycosyltransferase involved in cell wall biosynthesis